MKQSKGLTIIQLMLILLVAGVLGWLAVGAIIDMRCEQDSSSRLCAERAQEK